MYPEFTLHLFFILPVKVKWLALLQWLGYFWMLVFGPLVVKALTLASIANFLVFFGKSILPRMRNGRRRMVEQAQRIRSRNQARHCCQVCGITELSHPEGEFRYCSKCEGTPCYCSAHSRDHEHVAAERESAVR